MPNKPSKRYREALDLVPEGAVTLEEALNILKKMPPPKFDQTVEISTHTTADSRRSDQMVRGTCQLPHGSGKTVRVLVFAEGDAAKAAEDAGADIVGYEDIIKKVQDGFSDFDVAVATPAAMAEVRKLGRFLGPRGLMPNPKAGTVTDDTATAVKDCKAGRVEFKLDRNGNIAAPVGNLSFETNVLVENAEAVITSIVRARQAAIKGSFLESLAVSATMSPAVRVDPSTYLNF